MLGFRQMAWSSSAQAQAPSEQLCEGAAAVVAARQGMETPLTAVAEAFEELARGMEADGGELRLAPFSDTCALVSVLFSSLGMAFRFAEIEYVTKVRARPPIPSRRSIPFAIVQRDLSFFFPFPYWIICFACTVVAISVSGSVQYFTRLTR
jgi:hypothetical protein